MAVQEKLSKQLGRDATIEEIAQMAGIEKNFVDFKLNILTAKGYQLPAVPELKSNFLKDSMKNCSKCYD